VCCVFLCHQQYLGVKKKVSRFRGEGEFGCFVIFYVCSVTLGGSSAPLCGSYLLYSHYLFCVVVVVVLVDERKG